MIGHANKRYLVVIPNGPGGGAESVDDVRRLFAELGHREKASVDVLDEAVGEQVESARDAYCAALLFVRSCSNDDRLCGTGLWHVALVRRLLEPDIACRAALVVSGSGVCRNPQGKRFGAFATIFVDRELRRSGTALIETLRKTEDATIRFRASLREWSDAAKPRDRTLSGVEITKRCEYPCVCASVPRAAAWVAEHGFGADRLASLRAIKEQYALSDREMEILVLLMPGWNPKEICARLGSSGSTVRHQIRHLRAKLGVATAQGIWGLVLRNGRRGEERRGEERRGCRRGIARLDTDRAEPRLGCCHLAEFGARGTRGAESRRRAIAYLNT